MSLNQYIPSFKAIEFVPLSENCTDKLWQFHISQQKELEQRLETLQKIAQTDNNAVYILENMDQPDPELKKVTRAHYQQFIDCLNLKSNDLPKVDSTVLEGHFLYHFLCEEIDLLHLLRLTQLQTNPAKFSRYEYSQIELGHFFFTTELRQLAEAFERFGFHHAKYYLAERFLHQSNTYELSYYDNHELVWPFFAENLAFLEEALGIGEHHLLCQYFEPNKRSAMRLLCMLPRLPEQFLPVLKSDALSGKKSIALLAQQRLKDTAEKYAYIAEGLASSKQDVRLSMAHWLSTLHSPQALTLIEQQLKIEKRETVKAVLLTALEKQGADIKYYLNPDVLLSEANKGLTTKPPVSMSWFNLDLIHTLTWQDGTAVAPAIAQWWVVLAVKLKSPSSEGLLQRYLNLLSPASAEQLGLYVLHSYIHEDTRGPSYTEASIEAATLAQQDFQYYQRHYSATELANAGITLEHCRQTHIKHIMQRYAGSASDAKGMLALISGIDGLTLVPLVQRFTAQHYQRRSSIESLLLALANKDDLRSIQWIIHEARNNRTAILRNTANKLILAIAERKQWTELELQDRTIPTAGLDENGTLTLDYDTRQLSAKLSDSGEFLLYTPEGKQLKTLPSARKLDNPEIIKETRKTFKALKEELQDTLALQSKRLANAAMNARQWLFSDWQRDYLQHPIMRLLVKRVIWLATDDQQNIQSFRPTEDGCLLNLNDDELELAPEQIITIAHADLLSIEDANAWQQHFIDYKTLPLFNQLHPVLPADLDLSQTQVNHLKGTITYYLDAFNYLSTQDYEETPHLYNNFEFTLTNLEYNLCASITGTVGYSSYIPSTLDKLRFHRVNDARALALAEVPRPFLARCYADYEHLSRLNDFLSSKAIH
ncbi:DUF4132 domain-containing protein [Pseudomonas sp. F1_0610]|uniref:DUF4132 domain-containing protein n=1 Tax=Pseudomonas sp. F1_0610 TaxID=3114284 RepID=UPI0039C19845